MKCVNCKKLDARDKKEGCVSGCLYYCKLKREYIYVNDNCCDNFEKDVKDTQLVDKMIQESKEYDDIAVSPVTLLMIFIILVILGLFMGVF